MQIKNRQQLLTILALTAVVLLGGDRLILSPLVKAWKERASRIATLKRSIEQGQTLITRAESIRGRWSEMSTNTLPTDSSQAENAVLKAFDRWSQDSSVSITSLKPQWKQSEDDYLLLECRADGFGSIQNVTRFIYEMEKDPLALRIESIDLGARDKDGKQLEFGIQVSGLALSTKP